MAPGGVALELLAGIALLRVRRRADQRDVALIDAGFDVDVSANARLGIDYVGQFARDAQGHAVKDGCRVRF